LIGIPIIVAALAAGIWFMFFNEREPETEAPEQVFDIFSDPLPDDCPIQPLGEWLPDITFDALIWGDYIVELPEDIEYTQLHDGASLNDLDLTGFLNGMGMSFEEILPEQLNNESVSILPLRIVTGPNNINQRYVADLAKEGYGFILYSVYSVRNRDIRNIGLPYKVEGNKIVLYLEWKPGSAESPETEVYNDSTIEMEFYFEGYKLILERNGVTVTMIPRQFKNTEPLIRVDHQVSGSLEFAEIKSITHIATPFMPVSSFINFNNDSELNTAVTIDLYSNGIMRISTDHETSNSESSGQDKNVLWVRSIWCGNDGLILVDGNGQTYLYQEPIRSVIEEAPPPAGVEDEPPPEEVPLTLLERLEIALSEADIEHDIDMLRGTVTADTSVLFEISRSVLSEDGKEYLKRYLDVLADIVLSDDYTGSVARIIVEGHTCSWGTYEENMVLSVRRAQAVKDFAVTVQPELAELMDTIGMSYDDPILDENGNEDRDASRRVVFRFVLGTPVT
jgi:chemotaxis protein MotB